MQPTCFKAASKAATTVVIETGGLCSATGSHARCHLALGQWLPRGAFLRHSGVAGAGFVAALGLDTMQLMVGKTSGRRSWLLLLSCHCAAWVQLLRGILVMEFQWQPLPEMSVFNVFKAN